TVNAIVTGTYFDRIVLVMFENTGYNKTIVQPYFQNLTIRSNGLVLSNYFAVAHPSQPNYIATIFGSTANVTDDSNHDIAGINLVDRLEAAGISWKAYMEDYPGNCDPISVYPKKTKLYARKHNPFISMDTIRLNSTRCAKIVAGTQLDSDITATFANNWLQNWLEPKLTQPAFTTNTLIFITFDEDDGTENNHIYSALVGSPVVPPPNHDDNTACNHYSYLATVEANWNLPNLGRNDVGASTFTTHLVHP
ncbi:5947_t:CDS:2, partial [Racocetra persica]